MHVETLEKFSGKNVSAEVSFTNSRNVLQEFVAKGILRIEEDGDNIEITIEGDTKAIALSPRDISAIELLDVA